MDGSIDPKLIQRAFAEDEQRLAPLGDDRVRAWAAEIVNAAEHDPERGTSLGNVRDRARDSRANRRWIGRHWVGALLGAGLVVATGVIAYRHEGKDDVASASISHHYETRSGRFATIELTDGSTITLAPRSHLTITSNAHTESRVVSLVGEAQFSVLANAHAPFVVQTGAVQTRVLGTSFAVRRYADDISGEVTVQSGRVVTQGRGVPVTIVAGMSARFTDSLVTASDVSPDAYTDWSNHQLVFRDAPVPVVLATLRSWYGYDFRLADSALARRHIIAVFPIGEASEMLTFVQHVLGVRMTFDDSVVTLYSNASVQGPVARPRSAHESSFTTTSVEKGR